MKKLNLVMALLLSWMVFSNLAYSDKSTSPTGEPSSNETPDVPKGDTDVF